MVYYYKKGFTLIELLVAIAIIALLSTLGVAYLVSVRKNANDTKRKNDLHQIGRFMAQQCFLPGAGENDYDLLEIVDELKVKYPQLSLYISKTPHDPKAGTSTESKYRYIISEAGNKCALYANLENNKAEVSLHSINSPTPKGGTGIFQAANLGWNGSDKYFQISN